MLAYKSLGQLLNQKLKSFNYEASQLVWCLGCKMARAYPLFTTISRRQEQAAVEDKPSPLHHLQSICVTEYDMTQTISHL